jgi:hypothetical protein
MLEALKDNGIANEYEAVLGKYVSEVPKNGAHAQSHCHKVCPVCGKWCVQPPGHGGPCYCPNQHSGYW